MPTDIDMEIMAANCITAMLNNYNTGISKEQFYAKNIVDSTDVTEDDMSAANDAVIQYCDENRAFAALPPFEEGSFIDRAERRYVCWKVLDVADDYFRIQFDHYPIVFADDTDLSRRNNTDLTALVHNCWCLACRVVVKVKVLTAEEYATVLSYHPEIAKNYNPNTKEEILKWATHIKSNTRVGGVIESYTYYMPDALAKIAKKGKYNTPDGRILNGSYVREAVANTMKYAAGYAKNSMLYVSVGPILEMFQYINCMLSQGTTKISTHRSVSASYSIVDSETEVRKERHFGKIKTVSVKRPKVVNKQNVQRVYTTMSWPRRSHPRHLKSGKVVVVKSATCHRHEVEKSEVPQIIYKL